jgi:hypothetical protein
VAALKPAEIHDRLAALYRAKLGRKPAFPEPGRAGGASTPGPSKDQRQQAQIQWMRDQLRPAFTPSKAELEQLGKARALAVRDALLADSAIDPTRVFMATATSVQPTDAAARLELKLR